MGAGLQLAFAIVSMCLKYGPTLVKKLLETWSKSYNDITADDIEKLKELIKHPDEYLTKDETTE